MISPISLFNELGVRNLYLTRSNEKNVPFPTFEFERDDMPMTDEDLAVLKICYEENHWYGAEIFQQFQSKEWSIRTVNDAIKRLQKNWSHLS